MSLAFFSLRFYWPGFDFENRNKREKTTSPSCHWHFFRWRLTSRRLEAKPKNWHARIFYALKITITNRVFDTGRCLSQTVEIFSLSLSLSLSRTHILALCLSLSPARVHTHAHLQISIFLSLVSPQMTCLK